MTPDEQRLQRIRDRAYVISQSPDTATDEEHWLRAEREIDQEDADAIRRAATERGHEVAIRTALTHP